MRKQFKNNEKLIRAEGGGGCFPAGTKVNTPKGYRFIEDIQVGDEVYAFSLKNREIGMQDEQPGLIFVQKVKETFKHSFGEVGYTSPLLEITYHGKPDHGYEHNGTLIVTGNHYILTPSRQSENTDEGFARADELEIGDIIWTEYGDEVTITDIKNGNEYDFVYNLEVEDLHTYIAGGIRVHNGGGGKSSHTPVQAPNSVKTNQVIRALFCLGEGEIGGLYNDDWPQSVFFDGTVLKNADGTYNFNNIAVDTRVGLPDQTVIEGFSSVEASTELEQSVTTTSAVTKTVTSSSIDAVRIDIQLPSGLQQIDTKNGDANGTSVQLTLQRRVAGGTWETVLMPVINEMSSGAFTRGFLIQRPAQPGLWDWKVIRNTADSTSNNLINATQVKDFTEIQNVKLPYNNRALVAVTVSADSTNGSIPAVSFDVKGTKVSVPSNYNVTNRTYSGSWDGTFASVKAVTDNPAWVIYDLLTHTRYGMGVFGVDPNRIDRYSFYEMAKYCDELVPKTIGSGVFEPRFTFNAQLMVQENAWKTIQAIAATANAKIAEFGGNIIMCQDRPASPTRIINNSNVVEGLFTYTSSASEDTYTQVDVTYSEPDDNFLPVTVTEVASIADRARYHQNSTSLAAYGATSQSQARRAAKWVLDTSLRQSSIVTFAVSLENAAFEPNEVFYLMDKDYSQTTQEGRVVTTNGSFITLDRAITIGDGVWTINVYSADGATIETRTIMSTGTTATLSLNSPVVTSPGSVYIVTGSIKPRQFRLTSLTDNDDLTYTVQAVQHDPNKYARIEQGIIVPDEVYWQNPPLDAVDIPKNIQVTPNSAFNGDGQIYRTLQVSWDAPADGTAVSYQFQWRRNGQPVTTLQLQTPFAIIPADFSGFYEFYINGINNAGVASPTASATYEFDFEGGTEGDVTAITGLRLANGSTYFNGTMQVLWNKPVSGQVKSYYVTLSNSGGGTPFKTFETYDTGFTYTYEQNVADGGPRPAIQVTVFARDTLNKTGPGVAALFSSQPTAGVSNLQVRGGGTVFDTLDLNVTWNSSSASGLDYRNDPDFAYFNVQVLNGNVESRVITVADASFTYSFNDNVKDNGQDTPSKSITLVVTAYNRLGVASTPATGTFTPAAPPAVTNFFVKGTNGTIFAQSDLITTWNAMTSGKTAFSSSNMFKAYKVEAMVADEVKRTTLVGSEDYTYSLDMNTADHGGLPIRNPILRVTSVNVYNVTSTPLSVTFQNPPPAIPSNIQVVPGLGNYKVSFDMPQEFDYLGTYVWADTTSGFTPSPANLVTDMAGAYASIQSIPGVKYYVRVASYDVFGKGAKDGTGLNISGESIVTADTAGIIKSDTPPENAKEGDAYINTVDGKLYRFHNGTWIANVSAEDIAGQIKDGQIATVSASKIAGQVISDQIASLTAGKLTGQISNTQISDNSISTPKLQAGSVTVNKLLVIPESIIPDPYFYDTQWWTETTIDAGWTFENSAQSNVPFVMNVPRSATLDYHNLGTRRAHIWTGQHPLSGNGQQMRFRARVYNASNQQAFVALRFFDPQGQSLSDVNLVVAANSGVTVPQTIFTVPTNTASYTVILYNQGGVEMTGGYIGVSEVKLDLAASADLIVDGAIIAGKVAANAIDAGNIKAGAITTEKLLVTSQGNAINSDPGLQDVNNAWSFENGMLVGNGTASAGAVGNTYFYANGGKRDVLAFTKQTYIIDPSKTYKASAKLYNDSSDSNAYVYVNFYDLNGNQISSANTGWGGRMSGYTYGDIPPLGSVFTECGGQFGAGTNRPIPSNTKTVQIGVWLQYNGNGTGAGFQAAQDIRLERANDGSLIVDGVITASKIAVGGVKADNIDANAVTTIKLAADSVSTDKLKVNSVTAGILAANAVTTDKINAEAITGDKIKALTIDASKIDTRGLSIKDANGNVILASGTSLNINYVPAGALNSNVTPALIGAIGLGNKLTTQNISNYFSTAAIDGAYIGTIYANQINSNGLTIRDNNGNVILGSGIGLPLSYVPAGALNSNVTASSIGAVGSGNPITSSNVSTYIASAAIQDAQIGSVTASKISASSLSAISANVGTLRTATSGGRTEIYANVIKVYGTNNALAVQIGDLSA